MRCGACDCELTDFEATRRLSDGGNFLDLCNTCYATIANDLETTERYDLYDPNEDFLEWESEGGNSINPDSLGTTDDEE